MCSREEQRARVAGWAFWVCLVCSISLIVGGFFVPPTGVIDGTVLTAVGELFAFAALGVGYDALRMGRNLRIEKGDFSAEITRKHKGGAIIPPPAKYRENGQNNAKIEERTIL